MKSRAQHLATEALASHLEVDPRALHGTLRLAADLGVDGLDLVLVVLKLEANEPGRAEFPFADLELARTVDDFADLVESWQAEGSDVELRPRSASLS